MAAPGRRPACSVLRCLIGFSAGLRSTRANLYRPYVYTSIGVAAAAAIFVAVKGALYDYQIQPSWMARLLPHLGPILLHSGPAWSCRQLSAFYALGLTHEAAAAGARAFCADAGLFTGPRRAGLPPLIHRAPPPGPPGGACSLVILAPAPAPIRCRRVAIACSACGWVTLRRLARRRPPASMSTCAHWARAPATATSPRRAAAARSTCTVAARAVRRAAAAIVAASPEPGQAAYGMVRVLRAESSARGLKGAELYALLARQDVELALRETGEQDMPAMSMADADSQFASLEGLSVHYKVFCSGEAPAAAHGSSATGVLLLHGFGSGVFAWRHVAPLLSRRCPGIRVVAFDRAGFGCATLPSLRCQRLPGYQRLAASAAAVLR